MWLRLRQIALVAGNFDKVASDFRELLGIEVCYRDPGIDADASERYRWFLLRNH